MIFNDQDLGFTCCFCNNGIASDKVNPCDLNILINMDKPKDKQDNRKIDQLG